MMNKANFFICMLLLASRGLALADSKADSKPNIIVIMADDLGYGDLACYGSTTHLTPNIDKLAKQGIQFMDFHSNGVVCSPTRASLLTGKYPQTTGISGVITAKDHRDVGLDLKELLISELLKKQDYRTGIVGKWHLGYDTTYSPVNQGFDIFRGFTSGNVDYLTHYDQENYFDWWLNTEKMDEKGYSTDLITHHSLDFIRENKDHPFFLYVAHEAPHGPYQIRDSRPERTGDPSYKPEPISDKKKVYGEMIRIMDEGIGKIIESLEQHGLAENTLVLFLSDNGANQTGSNSPYKGYKGQVWEGGHRIPAIAYWKGVIQSQMSQELLLTMDIYPTLAALTNTKIPKEVKLEGRDFSSVLRGKTNIFKPRPVFWAYSNAAAIREGKWKLVRVKNQYQLFDLSIDPSEKNNLFDKFPKESKKLSEQLATWEKEKSAIPMKS
ncbi:arylsulfatase A-like enzyme [Dyadobacter jejuensis]|uniref:Arylsulfatase A-like enzyme n=1 Tax=Dyadobacter jejuensis TaxID=1082580 RepID=A0A316AM58_9BACT|nr:sulfatase-like hydrolase/transferase [Dyadobacter jejuensis]PWJ57880.1 arylsulfatase A-like enzyme [Dyadobacter jejuensis]